MGALERWSAAHLGQWHYVLGYAIVLLAHNGPLLLALALCLFWGWRLYRRPSRRHVCWLFAALLIGGTYEYDKHVAPRLHASLDTVLGLEAAWLNRPAHLALGPLAGLLLRAATLFFLGQLLWLKASPGPPTGTPMTERRKTRYLIVAAALALGLVPLALSLAGGGGGPKGATSVALPLIASDRPTATATTASTPGATATATATATAGASATATSTTTATAGASATATSTATATATAGPGETGANYTILVGPGYTDVSPKALVRTTGDRLYIAVSNCEGYPCADAGQALRVYRANSAGVPTGFTLLDQGRAPAGVSQWAIAIDGGDTIHVVWNDRASSGANPSNLRYTTFSTAAGTWGGSVETVDGGLNLGLDGGGQGMQSVALALDASGAPHVVYLKGDGAGRRAFYRNRVGGAWSAAAQLDDGVAYGGNQKAWHPNLAFDPAGRLLAVWQRGSFNGDNDGTIFGRVRAANGGWGAAVNISGDNTSRVIIDQSTSLLITPEGRYHITWIAAATDYVRYQYSDDQGQSWSANHPGGGTQATHNPALGYAAGRLRIYGHGTPVPPPDGHGEDLYFFEGGGGPGAWGPWTRFVTGADYDSSVSVRWAQFFNRFPNTIDLAYWNDNYPNVLYAGTEITGP